MSVWLLNAVFEGAFPLVDLIATSFGAPLLLPTLESNPTSITAAKLWKLSCVCFCGLPSWRAWKSGSSDRSLALGSFLYHVILVWLSVQSVRGIGGMPVGPHILATESDNLMLLSGLQGAVHGFMALVFLQHLHS